MASARTLPDDAAERAPGAWAAARIGPVTDLYCESCGRPVEWTGNGMGRLVAVEFRTGAAHVCPPRPEAPRA